MFNIDKAIEKLDELVKAQELTGVVYRPCWEDIRTVLWYGKEPIPKELKIGGYQTLALRIEEMQKKIMFLEADRGHRVKELEKRVEQTEMSLKALEQMVVRGKKDAQAVCDRQLCTDQEYTEDGGCHKCPAGEKPSTPTDGKDEMINVLKKKESKEWGSIYEPIEDVILIALDARYMPDDMNINLVKDIISLVRSHVLPKDKILVDRKVAKDWVKTFHGGFLGEGVSSNLLNELRKALKENP